MSKTRSAGSKAHVHSLDIENILIAASNGALSAPAAKGRRARRRISRQKMTTAGLIAPLLAVEGCKTLSSEELPLNSNGNGNGKGNSNGGGNSGGSNGHGNSKGDAPGGGAVPEGGSSAQPDSFETDVDAPIETPVSALLENDIQGDGGALQVVRVFNAVNGTVELDDGVIRFTPKPGFEGAAGYSYEVRDSNGFLSQAVVEVTVGEGASDDGGSHGGGSDDGGAGSGGMGGMVHPDDPAKASEHMAVLDLVKVSEATHVAVKNGSWFDPDTWAGGEVPGEGAKVLIPEGIMVDYDGESDVSLFTVRVDGVLDFATDQNTFMEVDTFVVTPTGYLKIGSIDNPVAANVQAVIQFADNGPIDVAWDPQLLSRGLVSHGTVEISGAEKDTFLKVTIDAMAGDTSMTLESPPQGWQVGDKLVLTGTHLTEAPGIPSGQVQDLDTEDEELIITAIDGNVVYFDRPLEYDHDTPRADLNAYVANYSRNVTFMTENSDDVPVYQRGHVMLMHSDNIDVRYAEFNELGRTDKSQRAFDFDDLDSTSFDSNMKGRYSLHIHRAGFSDIDDPAMLVGNAVWGSPGWGFVHHDSNAILANNAAYDVFGAAFVAETGNETGRWTQNIAIKSIGISGIGDSNIPKSGDDVTLFDNGRTGAGFWFQGRTVDAVDNVAAGIPSGQAFIYMSRAPLDDAIPVLPESIRQSESLAYRDGGKIYLPAISQFEGNEAIASRTGLMVVKPMAEQGHDVRSTIEDFTAWDVRYGAFFQYTAHYTLKDIDVIAADGYGEFGIHTGQNTYDFVINGAKIEGFDIGVHLSKISNKDGFDGDFQYAFIDVDVTGSRLDFYNTDANDKFLTQSDLLDQLKFQSALDDYPVFGTKDGEWWMEFPGTKSDSIGDIDIQRVDNHRFRWDSLRGAIAEEGYWSLPDGRIVTAFERYFSDRATGEMIKVSTFVEVPGGTAYVEKNASGAIYHGILDPDSNAPVAGEDFATVRVGESIMIDVLANDFDPDGDIINLDGLVGARNGSVYQNDDGTVTYIPDPDFSGADKFCYWVEDDNGNFTMGEVNVTVEI